MLSGFVPGLAEWLTLYRVELFAAGLIIAVALLLNWTYEPVPVPVSWMQPFLAAVILFLISFIWTYTDGGWELFFDRISFITMGAALGAVLAPILQKYEVI